MHMAQHVAHNCLHPGIREARLHMPHIRRAGSNSPDMMYAGATPSNWEPSMVMHTGARCLADVGSKERYASQHGRHAPCRDRIWGCARK